jgi:hypothetical protein
MLKRLVYSMLSFALVLSISSSAYAGNIPLYPTDEDSHRTAVTEEASPLPFVPYVNSNGTFTFDINHSILSNSFTITSTSTRITMTATTNINRLMDNRQRYG